MNKGILAVVLIGVGTISYFGAQYYSSNEAQNAFKTQLEAITKSPLTKVNNQTLVELKSIDYTKGYYESNAVSTWVFNKKEISFDHQIKHGVLSTKIHSKLSEEKSNELLQNMKKDFVDFQFEDERVFVMDTDLNNLSGDSQTEVRLSPASFNNRVKELFIQFSGIQGTVNSKDGSLVGQLNLKDVKAFNKNTGQYDFEIAGGDLNFSYANPANNNANFRLNTMAFKNDKTDFSLEDFHYSGLTKQSQDGSLSFNNVIKVAMFKNLNKESETADYLKDLNLTFDLTLPEKLYALFEAITDEPDNKLIHDRLMAEFLDESKPVGGAMKIQSNYHFFKQNGLLDVDASAQINIDELRAKALKEAIEEGNTTRRQDIFNAIIGNDLEARAKLDIPKMLMMVMGIPIDKGLTSAISEQNTLVNVEFNQGGVFLNGQLLQ